MICVVSKSHVLGTRGKPFCIQSLGDHDGAQASFDEFVEKTRGHTSTTVQTEEPILNLGLAVPYTAVKSCMWIIFRHLFSAVVAVPKSFQILDSLPIRRP